MRNSKTHLLIALHFNAPHGGLHDNVYSTARHCVRNGLDVTVLSKAGDFANKLKKNGINTFAIDYDDLSGTYKKLARTLGKKIDVIHTHPGVSRELTIKLAEEFDIPIIMTVHGMWDDKVSTYSNKLNAIFAVSEGVKDYLKTKLTEDNSKKIFVMQNGVDLHSYKYTQPKLSLKRVQRISLISRLDADKQFILDIYYKALVYTSSYFAKRVEWTIVGDGSEKNQVKKLSEEISRRKQNVNFVGWKEGASLVKQYTESDIVIAPGRSALEAMAVGKPVIAIGSKNYSGLVDQYGWLNGVYTNFGGVGSKIAGYEEGQIEKDLSKVIFNRKTQKALGLFGRQIVEQFYNEEYINNRIMSFYNIVKLTRKIK